MASDLITSVTDDAFQTDVLDAQIPVLVDFWAQWCGPCKMIMPILEDIATEYANKLKIVKINVDENKKIPSKYNVRGIPTLILFKNGNAEATKVGAVSRTQLTAFLDSYI